MADSWEQLEVPGVWDSGPLGGTPEDMPSLWSAEKAAAGHPFRATVLVPGWCARCGCAAFVHES